MEIASNLTLTRSELPYRKNSVYKGVVPRGDKTAIDYRELYLPGPTEILAEAALLATCSQAGGYFKRHPCAFSNVLSEAHARHGMVDPYFIWWKNRQVAIENAARAVPGGRVVYFDIRKFYDSVEYSQVSKAWRECCERSGLPTVCHTLGEKLISDYQCVKSASTGLLVGPMFAHVLGNLVLGGLDRLLASEFPGRYFRYVDDIAIVIDSSSFDRARDVVKAALPGNLRLNEEKTLELECAEWVGLTASLPPEEGTYYWGRLVGSVKYFLVAHSEKAAELERMLLGCGFRLPLRSYSRSLTDLPYLKRLAARFRRRRLTGHYFPQSAKEVLALAMSARRELQTRFLRLVGQKAQHGMRRKFQIQKIRYVAARLLYLAEPAAIRQNYAAIEGTFELSDLSAIYNALATSDVSELLSFSSSVAQSAAQVLTGKVLDCKVSPWRPELESAWAVLRASGMTFAPDSTKPGPTELVQFATQSASPPSADPYYKEVFALAQGGTVDYPSLLRTAFDFDEEFALDAIQLLHASS